MNKNNKINKSRLGKIINKKLIILMIVAIAVTSILSIFIQMFFTMMTGYVLAEDYATNFEHTITKQVDEAITNVARIILEMNGMDYSNNDSLKNFFEEFYDSFSSISYVDSDGIIKKSSDPTLIGYDMHSSQYMTDIIDSVQTKGTDSYFPGLENIPTDTPLNYRYAATKAPDNSGILLIGFNNDNIDTYKMTYAQQDITDARIGFSGEFTLCDLNKNIIACSENSGITLNQPFPYPELLSETDNKTILETVEYDGKKSYMCTLKTPQYYIITSCPREDVGMFNIIIDLFVFIFIAIIVIILFIALNKLIKRLVVNSVEGIHTSLKKITDGNLTEKVNVRNSLEFNDLSDGINNTVDKLKNKIEEEKNRIAEELQNARHIQESAVPNIFPPYPDNENFGLHAYMNAAKEVGGDFYDYFLLDKKTLVIVIADVSGKGMPAALYMMRAKTLISSFAEYNLSVDEIASKTNIELCKDVSSDMFVTAWLGILDLGSGILQFVHAGHTAPILLKNRNNRYFSTTLDCKTNLVLGGLEKAKYTKQEIQLEYGDGLFLYTDGVNEAMNENNVCYGTDRLLRLFNKKIKNLQYDDRNDFCKKVCETVIDDVNKYINGADQSDDMTMVCLQYTNENKEE